MGAGAGGWKLAGSDVLLVLLALLLLKLLLLPLLACPGVFPLGLLRFFHLLNPTRLVSRTGRAWSLVACHFLYILWAVARTVVYWCLVFSWETPGYRSSGNIRLRGSRISGGIACNKNWDLTEPDRTLLSFPRRRSIPPILTIRITSAIRLASVGWVGREPAPFSASWTRIK